MPDPTRARRERGFWGRPSEFLVVGVLVSLLRRPSIAGVPYEHCISCFHFTYQLFKSFRGIGLAWIDMSAPLVSRLHLFLCPSPSPSTPPPRPLLCSLFNNAQVTNTIHHPCLIFLTTAGFDFGPNSFYISNEGFG